MTRKKEWKHTGIKQKQNKTIIMTMHDFEFAKNIADLILYLENGKILYLEENKNFFKIFEVMFDNGYQAWLISDELTIITRETIELEAKKSYLDRMHGNFFFSSKELLITTSS